MKKSAGIIIILNDNKILLSHSVNSKWKKTFSFPKGGIEKGERKIEAAIRELQEETSIVITQDQIFDKEPIVIEYNDKLGEIYKKVYLYKVYINDISEIGLTTEIVPYTSLQEDELDWCGFLTKEDALPRIFGRVEHLLDLIN
jgi:8-oxo-dGTP pyrophosphatase MutT (NUDIX family)